MNITLYSHEAFARYILYCAIFGFCAFIIHCVICVIISIPIICKCNSFVKLKACISDTSETKLENQFLPDFLGALIISISLLAVSFISNSGEFRIVSIPLLLAGVGLGSVLFKKNLTVVMSYICFCVKKIMVWISAPILFLIRILMQVINRVFGAIKKRSHTAQIVRYTKKRYKDLDRIKQMGLLEHLFEVV